MISINQFCRKIIMDTNVKVQWLWILNCAIECTRFQQKHDTVSPIVQHIHQGVFAIDGARGCACHSRNAAVETLLGRQFCCQCELLDIYWMDMEMYWDWLSKAILIFLVSDDTARPNEWLWCETWCSQERRWEGNAPMKSQNLRSGLKGGISGTRQDFVEYFHILWINSIYIYYMYSNDFKDIWRITPQKNY